MVFRCCATRRPGAAARDVVAVTAAPPATVNAPAPPAPGGGRPELSFGDSNCLAEALVDCMEKGRPLHTSCAMPDAGALMDMDSLFAALVRNRDSGNVAAYKRGEPYVRDNLYLAYLDNASLILYEAERDFPALLKICQSLSSKFDYVTARVVLDPPAMLGPPLLPESDVVTLHISGEQSYNLCKPDRGLPVTAPRPAPLLSCTVRPGDSVFIPSGVELRVRNPQSQPLLVVPEATTASGSSAASPMIYVVFSLRTGNHSVSVSLGKYVNDLLRQKLPDDTNTFLRSSITKHTLPDRNTGEAVDPANPRRVELQASLRKSAGDLASRVTAAGLREHYEERMRKMREEQEDGAAKGAARSGERLPPDTVTTQSFVRVSEDVVCQCTPGQTVAKFTRGGETLTLPIAASASYLIHDISDGKPHAVHTLTCADPAERLCVCQILVYKECVELSEK